MHQDASMVVVVGGGPYDGEQFITATAKLSDGVSLRFLGIGHTLRRHPETGRWVARYDGAGIALPEPRPPAD